MGFSKEYINLFLKFEDKWDNRIKIDLVDGNGKGNIGKIYIWRSFWLSLKNIN